MFLVFDVNDQSGSFTRVAAAPGTTVQQLVGCADAVPVLHRRHHPPYRAYIHPYGLAHRLSFNFFAWAVLDKLGFADDSKGYHAYCGHVVLTGNRGQGLVDAEIADVQRACDLVMCKSTHEDNLTLSSSTSSVTEWDTYPKLKQGTSPPPQ